MIELIQIPWSPFCLVQRRILEFAGVPFKLTNIPPDDRSLVWRLSRQRYYAVPLLRDGRRVIFEMSEESQVIAKYLDEKFGLGLFPRELEGVQFLLWRYLESEIEGLTFKLNDIHWKKFVPPADHLRFLRHKERKFGHGCLDQWRVLQPELLKQLEEKLMPFEEMLAYRPFLLAEGPRFVDFDLFGMLGNFLFSGRYRLPPEHNHLADWHRRMRRLKPAA